jgi:hypothetical protein
MVWELGLQGQSISLQLAHFARVSFENLDAAGRTASIPAATMKDVDSGIFNNQN